MLGDIWKGEGSVVVAEYFSLDTVICVGSCCMLWCGLWLVWLVWLIYLDTPYDSECAVSCSVIM